MSSGVLVVWLFGLILMFVVFDLREQYDTPEFMLEEEDFQFLLALSKNHGVRIVQETALYLSDKNRRHKIPHLSDEGKKFEKQGVGKLIKI